MRGRWLLVVVSLAIAAGGAWYFLRPRELPYEPISEPRPRRDAGPRSDAGR